MNRWKRRGKNQLCHRDYLLIPFEIPSQCLITSASRRGWSQCIHIHASLISWSSFVTDHIRETTWLNRARSMRLLCSAMWSEFSLAINETKVPTLSGCSTRKNGTVFEKALSISSLVFCRQRWFCLPYSVQSVFERPCCDKEMHRTSWA